MKQTILRLFAAKRRSGSKHTHYVRNALRLALPLAAAAVVGCSAADEHSSPSESLGKTSEALCAGDGALCTATSSSGHLGSQERVLRRSRHETANRPAHRSR